MTIERVHSLFGWFVLAAWLLVYPVSFALGDGQWSALAWGLCLIVNWMREVTRCEVIRKQRDQALLRAETAELRFAMLAVGVTGEHNCEQVP